MMIILWSQCNLKMYKFFARSLWNPQVNNVNLKLTPSFYLHVHNIFLWGAVLCIFVPHKMLTRLTRLTQLTRTQAIHITLMRPCPLWIATGVPLRRRSISVFTTVFVGHGIVRFRAPQNVQDTVDTGNTYNTYETLSTLNCHRRALTPSFYLRVHNIFCGARNCAFSCPTKCAGHSWHGQYI